MLTGIHLSSATMTRRNRLAMIDKITPQAKLGQICAMEGFTSIERRAA